MAKQKELDENLVKILKQWQKIEDDSVKSTSDIIAKTKNLERNSFLMKVEEYR